MTFASLSSGGRLPSRFGPIGASGIRTLRVVCGIVFTRMAGAPTLLSGRAAGRARREGFRPPKAQRKQLVRTVPAMLALASALGLLLPLSAPPVPWALPGLPYAWSFLIGSLATRFRCHRGMA